MLNVNGRIIVNDVREIILTLRTQLAAQGLEYFNQITESGTNLQVTCPFHANGKERRASCGISCQQVKEIPAGTVHCFTCGWSGNLQTMISAVLGYDDFGAAGVRWLLKNFVTIEVDERPEIKLDFETRRHVKSTNFITEQELDKYRYYHSYLAKRGLTERTCDKFDIGYDPERDCITMPVRDALGRCLFVATRQIKSKFFNLPKDIEKPVYGLYEIGADKLKEILICESVFNAVTAYQYGRPAVALFGTGNKEQYEVLKNLPCRKFVLALDPDDAGERGTQRLINALGGHKILTRLVIPKGKDVNDLTREEFLTLREIFC